MFKQAIMRHLSRQDVANYLMTYVYGGIEPNVTDKERAASNRMQQATIVVEDDLLLVKGHDKESCDWVDQMIRLDNEKGKEIKDAIETKAKTSDKDESWAKELDKPNGE